MVEREGTLPESLEKLAAGVENGDDVALSRVISHVENRQSGYRQLMERIYEQTGGAQKIGITGPPGAGKSTIVDSLVQTYREEGKTVGVLAVDPASPYSGGSILGDRIRQRALADDEDVFFRSMSARNQSGGLTTATFDAIHALEAAGKDVILVETVGSGQSEVDIATAVDTVCVVLFPGAGDDVQANKAGILEIADIFAVNKADLEGAESIERSLEEMLEFGDTKEWKPPIVQTVAIDGTGISQLVNGMVEHKKFLEQENRLENLRNEQFKHEARLQAHGKLRSKLNDMCIIDTLNSAVRNGANPHDAAEDIIEELSLK